MENEENRIEDMTPIQVASYIIGLTITYESSALAKSFGAGDTTTDPCFGTEELREIADHLIVYCDHHDETTGG